MPAANHQKDEAPKAAHRRRSKPTFDVPEVAGEPGAPAGWVYREAARVPEVEHLSVQEAPPSNRLLSTGLGLFFVTAAPVAFISLLAIGFVTAPFGLATSAARS